MYFEGDFVVSGRVQSDKLFKYIVGGKDVNYEIMRLPSEALLKRGKIGFSIFEISNIGFDKFKVTFIM